MVPAVVEVTRRHVGDCVKWRPEVLALIKVDLTVCLA